MLHEIKIDATNQVFGRLATRVAHLLRGKDLPSFKPNAFPQRKIIITNIGRVIFTGQKGKQKIYWRHSGFPGNIRGKSLGLLFSRNPQKVFLKAVSKMLPTNKLRTRLLKNLCIYDSYSKG